MRDAMFQKSCSERLWPKCLALTQIKFRWKVSCVSPFKKKITIQIPRRKAEWKIQSGISPGLLPTFRISPSLSSSNARVLRVRFPAQSRTASPNPSNGGHAPPVTPRRWLTVRPSWGGLSNYVNSGTGQGYQQSIRPQPERPKVLASSRHWHRQIHRIPKGDSLVIAEPGGRGGADPERSGSIPLGLPPERTSSSPRGPDSFLELRPPRRPPGPNFANHCTARSRAPWAAREQRRSPAL